MNFIRESIRPDTENQVAVFQINTPLAEKYKSLKQELLKNPVIRTVTGGSNIPTFYGDSWPVMLNMNSQKVQMENYAIQDDYLETMGYELIAGRNMKSAFASDLNEGMILNETAVRELGFGSPEEALGQQILWGGENKKQGRIVGIVKDFHFQSFHNKIKPAVLQFAPYEWMTSQFVAIRFNPTDASNLQNIVEKAVSGIDPNWFADIHFLDENFLQLHESDRQLGQIFGSFAALAIFISCIGLFGLSAFAAVQRTREIGIRKVLGASVAGIVQLLSKEFLKTIFIALIIAIPIAWFGMHQWLESFEYRVRLSWWIFASTGLLVLLIASITIGYQGLRAAIANPIKTLRTE